MQNGKNICRINGKLVPLSLLKSVGDKLVDIHGQHEHQSLFNEKNHLSMLDSYGEEEISAPLLKVKEAYKEYKQTADALSKLTYGGDMERRLDILDYQIKEIVAADVKPEEEEELLEERNIQMNAQRIFDSLNKATECLNGGYGIEGALSNIKAARNALGDIASLSKDYEKLLEKINECYYSLEENYYEIDDKKQSAYYDEGRLEQIEERIAQINTLKRKYGGSIEEMYKFLENSKQEYDDIANSHTRIAELEEKIQKDKAILIRAQEKLSEKRKKAAKGFEADMKKQLADLGFNACEFIVDITSDADTFSSKGCDTACFMISLNPGQPVKPLKKVASGGEVSRIMLALKNIKAGLDNIGTSVFDEVDSGISGRTAGVVALKMASIAKTRQVICVTHLAQIAAMSDKHFLIEKYVENGNTHTNVAALDDKAKQAEVARLSGGDITEVSLKHAADMIATCDKQKKEL